MARGCDYTDSYYDLGCIHATSVSDDEKASRCYCDTAKCNMAPMTSLVGHVTTLMVASLVINYVITAHHLL